MNKKIFITYGDSSYTQSVERIRKEAQDCEEFDEVIVFSDKDLPDEVRSNILFTYKRGGGYWLWKPYVCLKALEYCDESDIIVYSDAGNKIYKHKQWKTFWKWMCNHSAVFFYYGATMVQRSRKSLLMRYVEKIPYIKGMFQIQGNIFMFSLKAKPVIEEWYNNMIEHPEYVLDATKDEISDEFPEFIENRHDQPVLSCSVYGHWKELSIYVTRQRSERFHRDGQAVFNARISNDSIRKKMVFEKYHVLFIRKILVEPYRALKMFICKYSI